MTKQLTIGLVVPFSTDRVPDEGPMMYPGVKFIPRAVGVRALTPTTAKELSDAEILSSPDVQVRRALSILGAGSDVTSARPQFWPR